ncbi:Nucleotide-binding universal stress protein, UspA family [Hymenobacter daecheongensis DSM 21074]|uniref:Nucleotide-binding universal stress protein, UspA family n=1 Tax=Hymenobacter daecheongensis DSM 21074 TaxID=1121955 RepID=A0A1M6MEP3_9BACT|nr:universal stress protein [Hymenobacter daecheongensis]SHJ81826.1 Nucleotide-binding universal stress protein, UspA family [Hymenobacter daecheongensis DSM 21074]
MAVSLLILTDFFQAANRALDYATNLAGPLSARLVLLHVRRDSLLDPDTFTGELSNLNQEAIGLALNRVASNLSVPVVAEVGHGQVLEALADAVSRHQPALIVLGRPDYSGTPDELVETTSLDILRTAPYPMLVVPHTVSTTAPPRRVLLAVDGEPFTLGEHTGMARHLLTSLGCELTVLHVAAAAAAEIDPAALSAVHDTGLLIDLPAVHTRTVAGTSPADAILQAARAADFDLVVLIARRRSFLGSLFHHSVTAQVLLNSRLPVLVLPAE